MPRANPIIASWTKGEVSPLAHGRVDVNLYTMGAHTIENLIVRPQGPVFRRSGTKFVKKAHLNDTAIAFLTNSGGFYRLDLALPTDHQVGDVITVTGTGTPVDGEVTITGVSNTTSGFITTNKAYVSGAGASTGRIVRNIRCIPFIVSDETAYVLEFGDRYIHFYKNKEPLFETTTTEVEKYTIVTSGTNPQIDTTVDDDGDMPGWGDLSAFFIGPPADNGTLVTSNNGAGLVRVTTSVPHTLRSGVTVKMYQTANPNSLNGNTYVVDRISPYIVDLRLSAFVSNAGVTDTAMMSLGILAGDRVFFSGGEENTLGETFRDVKSVDTYDKFTVANYLSSSIVDTTPSGEEVHVIPIEVVTTYTENQIPDIHFVQSADVLYLFHPQHPVRKLVRLDTDGDRNDWLLADVTWTDGPYLPLNDLSPNVDTATPTNGAVYDDVYFEVSGYTHTANVTAAVAFAGGAGDQNKYLEFRRGDQWALAQLTSASSGLTTGTVSIVDNILARLDETVRLKTTPDRQSIVPGSNANSSVAYLAMDNREKLRLGIGQQRTDPNDHMGSDAITTNAPTTTAALAAGTITSQFSNTFAQADVGKYVRIVSNAPAPTAGVGPVSYWVQIQKIDSAASGGNKAKHSPSLALVSNYNTGNFVITGETRSATVDAFRNGSAFSAFASTDVGRMIRLGFAGRWCWGTIASVSSASRVVVTFQSDMPRDPHNAASIAGSLNPALTYSGAFVTGATTGRTYDWRLGAWSATTGYPAVGVFHEQRLWLGNTTVTPNTIWGSVSGDFENMQPTELDSTVLDDSAIAYTLASTQINRIKWMLSGSSLQIGTAGGEWQVRASSSVNDPITPSNIKATEYTSIGGSFDAFPARVGSATLFVDRSGEKVSKLFYSYDKDAIDADDLTVISEHILRDHGGGVRSCYQQKPHSIFWVLCVDGTLSGMTYNEKQEVIAWHHHTVQGGTVEDICTIPSEDASEDELWMVVKRTIGTNVVRYIEVLESDFYPSSTSSRLGMRFPDSHKAIEGFTGTTINGLDYLEGQTVVVVKDGLRITGTFTVTSGSVGPITAATSELVVGLNGTADLVSLPPEGGSQFGTSQGQKKRLVYMDTRFLNTSVVKFGPSFAALISKTLPVVSPTVWFTGTERLVPSHGYDVESSWYIRQDEPLPLNILFVVAKLETNE